MQQVRQKMKITLLASAILLLVNVAFANNASDRYIYIGSELGLSEPVVKKFVHKESNTKMRLKQSRMYGGRIGYAFYPGMMIELSATHQPKYRLAYRLPAKPLALGLTIPETPGETRVSANVFTLNLLYEMQEQFAGFKPYVIFGAGVARISIKPTTSTTDRFAPLGAGNNVTFFKIKKNNIDCFAWQVGGGFSRDLSDNFSIDIGAKLQVVNDIKIKYDTLNSPTTGTFSPAKPIKKTIGVGEFTLGFTFKIPV
jgi:opacity protein-like surface antigen